MPEHSMTTLSTYFARLVESIDRGSGNSTLAIAAVKATPGLYLVRARRGSVASTERLHPELKGRVLCLNDLRRRRAPGPFILDSDVLCAFARMAERAESETADWNLQMEDRLKTRLRRALNPAAGDVIYDREALLQKEPEAQLHAEVRAESEAAQLWGLDDDQRTAEEEDLAHQVEQLQAQLAELQKDLDLSQQRHIRVSRALDAMRKIGMDMAINPAQMLRALIDVQK